MNTTPSGGSIEGSGQSYGRQPNVNAGLQAQGSSNSGVQRAPSNYEQQGQPRYNFDIDEDFIIIRREVGYKLRQLYINKPANTKITMNEARYADRINS
jgi:hypothetical protein